MKEYLETETDTENKKAKIRELNDRLRQSFDGGQVMLTIGFRALPYAIILKALKAI